MALVLLSAAIFSQDSLGANCLSVLPSFAGKAKPMRKEAAAEQAGDNGRGYLAQAVLVMLRLGMISRSRGSVGSFF